MKLQAELSKKQSILGLIPLIDYVNENNIDASNILLSHGLDLDHMSGSAVIDQSVELAVVNDITKLFTDPLLGLKIGSRVTFTAYGTYAMLVMTAPNFTDAIKTAVQFQALSLLFSSMTSHVEDDYIELRYAMPSVDEKLRSFVADRDLIGTYLFVQQFFEQAACYLDGVGVARPRPEGKYLAEYRQYFGLNVEFDQPYNWLRMPRHCMTMEMKHGNKLAHQVYRAQASEIIKSLYSVTDDILMQSRLILSNYERDFPTMSKLAAMFSMSERTFRRKLEEKGSSYRELLDEQLKDRCFSLLDERVASVQVLSERLGYAEPASFLRAFKRWTGKTPRQYLKAELAQKT